MSAEAGTAIAPTYPDFYIEEIASGVHTIVGVSTSIALLGFFERGPMNQVGHVFSMADVQRTYDPFLPASEAGYGLQQFFLNGGTEADIVRVAAGSPAQVAAVDLARRFSGGRHPVPLNLPAFRTTSNKVL